MTTAFWFDLDGTLLGYERSFEALLEDCLESEVPPAVHETYRQALFVALESFDSAPYERGFEAIDTQHHLDLDPQTRAADYRALELEATTLTTGATEILTSVGEHGPVGILTNGDGEMQRAKIHRHDLGTLVDEVIVSNEVKTRKPDPEIFDIARDRLSADGHVYIGDSFEEDIVGARDAGFEAIHVRNDDGPIASVDRLGSLGLFFGTPGDTH